MPQLTIERIVPGGLGLARTPDGVALVRGAMPGERVEASLERRKGYLAGRVVEILEANPSRVDIGLPPGADLPLAYDAQLPIKQGIVAEAFRRAAKAEPDALQDIAASPEPIGYRTAAQYGVTKGRRLAAHEAGGPAPVELDADPLLSPPLQSAFDALKDAMPAGAGEVLLRGSLHEGKALVGLVTSRTGKTGGEVSLLGDVIAGVSRIRARAHLDDGRVVAGRASLLEDFGGIVTTVTVRSFAQVNPPAAGLLYQEAARLNGGGGKAVDLYAGSGVLAFHLAGGFDDLVAVESSIDAVRRGDADRKRLELSSVRFHAGDARAVAEHLPADLVSVNPPRAGMAPEVTAALAEARPRRVLYVSCDPPTWARDVKRLMDAGYRLTFARPYDFYPYTHHVEVLSILEHAGG